MRGLTRDVKATNEKAPKSRAQSETVDTCFNSKHMLVRTDLCTRTSIVVLIL